MFCIPLYYSKLLPNISSSTIVGKTSPGLWKHLRACCCGWVDVYVALLRIESTKDVRENVVSHMFRTHLMTHLQGFSNPLGSNFTRNRWIPNRFDPIGAVILNFFYPWGGSGFKIVITSRFQVWYGKSKYIYPDRT